jgi:hypothetical protein
MPRREIKRRRRKTSEGGYLTAHRRAVSDLEVQDLLAVLRREWQKIDRIERGNRLLDLAKRGCSTRGLGEALGQSATNILRYMTFPTLPEREREAIRSGSSAKEILALEAQADRRRKMRERVALDDRTGELSDHLADAILAFCKTIKRVPPTPVLENELVSFLSEARNAAWEMEASGVPPLKLPKRLDLRQRFQRTRPPVQEDLLYMAHLANWLAVLLRAEAPERPIWERAIEKAGKRSGELHVRLTISEHFRARRERELKLWELLLEGPPPRKRYPKGARTMAKQGSQPG